MFKIREFTVEDLSKGCVTDNTAPRFAWSFESDVKGVKIVSQEITIGDFTKKISDDQFFTYDGPALKPRTVYKAELTVAADNGEQAKAEITFETGKLYENWHGKFITDGDYVFTEKKVSPKVMVFKKSFELKKKKVKKARLYATAIGMYRMELNGKKVGDLFLTPGFTSYKTNLPYQTYDVTDML